MNVEIRTEAAQFLFWEDKCDFRCSAIFFFTYDTHIKNMIPPLKKRTE
jgi:hypothetical protein